MADLNIVTGKIEIDASALAKVINGLKQTKEGAEGVESVFQELGTTSDAFLKELDKGLKSSGAGFKSLRQQIKDAKDEATGLAAKFGENSQQALNATKRVAQLTEELDDFNQRVKALNPEAKFNAVSNALQGTLGALQGVTGALQLFGAESEEVTKIAQKLQGALNLAQGINSVYGLKDAFGNLRIMLGLTASAQSAVAAANTAEAETALTAAAANQTLRASFVELIATIGPYVAAFGAIIYGLDKLFDQWDAEIELSKKAEEAKQKQLKTNDELAKSYLELITDTSKMLTLKKEEGASELDLLVIKQKQLQQDYEFLKAAQAIANDTELIKNINKQINDNLLDQKIIRQQIANEIQRIYIQELQLAQAQRDREAASTQALKSFYFNEMNTQMSVYDRVAAIQKNFNSVLFKNANDRRAADLQAEITALEEKKKILEKFKEDTQLIDSEIAAKRSELRDIDIREAQEAEQRKQEIAQGLFNIVSSNFIDFYQNRARSLYEQDVANLEEAYRKKQISEEQYQAKLRELKIKAAKEDKQAAIFQATIDFSLSLIRALTTKNPTAALILATAVGGLNLARIIATPIPKFRQGQLPERSQPFSTEDNMLAMVGKSEAIIPAEKTKAFYPTLEAIYKGHISPEKLNSFVKGSKGKASPITLDTGGIERAIKKNKQVELSDKAVLAKMIGQEINRAYSRRRV